MVGNIIGTGNMEDKKKVFDPICSPYDKCYNLKTGYSQRTDGIWWIWWKASKDASYEMLYQCITSILRDGFSKSTKTKTKSLSES